MNFNDHYNYKPGLQTYVVDLPSLPGSSGRPPLDFVITTDSEFAALNKVPQDVVNKASQTGLF